MLINRVRGLDGQSGEALDKSDECLTYNGRTIHARSRKATPVGRKRNACRGSLHAPLRAGDAKGGMESLGGTPTRIKVPWTLTKAARSMRYVCDTSPPRSFAPDPPHARLHVRIFTPTWSHYPSVHAKRFFLPVSDLSPKRRHTSAETWRERAWKDT